MNSRFIIIAFAFIGKNPVAVNIALSGGLLTAAAVREPSALPKLLRRKRRDKRKTDNDKRRSDRRNR